VRVKTKSDVFSAHDKTKINSIQHQGETRGPKSCLSLQIERDEFVAGTWLPILPILGDLSFQILISHLGARQVCEPGKSESGKWWGIGRTSSDTALQRFPDWRSSLLLWPFSQHGLASRNGWTRSLTA